MTKLTTARKHALGISDFASGIGKAGDEPPVRESDRDQEKRADEKTEDATERSAAGEPVVDDDEPARAHHAPEGEGKVLEGAELPR